MASLARHNAKNPGVKRILQEAREIAADASAELSAAPLEDDLFQWHFTIRVPHSEFEGGVYHGRILLPAEYPLRPPEVMLLTPNGRFELNKRVCLTITGFHEDMWQPAWGIRTALMGLIAFFATEAKGAIGGLDTPAPERRRLAKLSRDWSCPTCKRRNLDVLPDPPTPEPPQPEASTSQTAEPAIVEPAAPSEIAAPPPPAIGAAPTPPPALTPTPTRNPTPPPPVPVLAADPPQIVAAAPVPAPVAPAPLEPAVQVPLQPFQQDLAAQIVARVGSGSVAPGLPQANNPPTWLDRLIVCLLVLAVGMAARGLQS